MDEKEKEIQESLGLSKPKTCACCTRSTNLFWRMYKIKPFVDQPAIWVCATCRMVTYSGTKILKTFNT